MKKTIKLVIKLLVIVLLIGVSSYLGYHMYIRYFVGSNADKPKVLKVVKNLSFNSRENLFTWDSVSHADSYIVSINGKEYNVQLNEMNYVPVSNKTEFKVKPVDSTGEYASPGWSKTYTYTLNNEFSYSKVSSYINDALPARDLKKVISAYVKDNSLYTNCYVNDGGKDKMMELRIMYDDEVNNIADCLSNDDYGVRVINSYDVANYDSASYLLQSNSFDGKMEQRRIEGYDFTVVASQTAKTKYDSVYHVFATYKLTKGDDIKYIESDMYCSILNPSSNEKANFTTKLLDTENIVLDEISYTELKGDEIDLAKSMDQVIIQKY